MIEDIKVMKETNEVYNEKLLLKKIDSLTSDVIHIIYSYLNGKAKYICFKKYDFIEKNIKDDFHKGYIFWNYVKNIINHMNKKQIILFIKGIIQNYPSIINRIWYLSSDTNNFYDGQKLFELWSNENDIIMYEKFYLEKIDVDIIDFKIKERMIDSIYNYILRAINRFEREKCMVNIFTNYESININNKGFELIEKSFKICKTLEYINEKLIVVNSIK